MPNAIFGMAEFREHPVEYLEAIRLEQVLRHQGLLSSTDTPEYDAIRVQIRELFLSVALRNDLDHIPSISKAAIYHAYFLGGFRDSILHKQLLDRAADAGDIHALSLRAENRWFGENGYEIDLERCEQDARKSHEGGSWGGSTVLAWVLRKKAQESGQPELEAEAVELLTQSFPKILVEAKAGDNIAQDWLAWRYCNGEGVAREVSCGAAWFRLSADNGLPWAMHWLGCRYLSGDGVEKNADVGKHWLRKAARHGVVDSEKLLREIETP